MSPAQHAHFLLLPQLRALDLVDMRRSDEPTGFQLGRVLAKMQHLQELNVQWSEVGDKLIEALLYGRRLSAWSHQTGQALDAEQLQWGQSNISRLRLAATNITQGCLVHLSSLRELHLLDIRMTGIRQSALLPLQKQFGMSSLLGGVLTTSNRLALAANENRVACACGNQEGKNTLDRWAKEGTTVLLFYD